MLNKSDMHSLSKIFALFSRVSEKTMPEILALFGAYIEKQGEAILNDPNINKDPIKLSMSLLNFRKEMDAVVDSGFCCHVDFRKKMITGFSRLLNCFDRAPLILAVYIDYEFKKGITRYIPFEINQPSLHYRFERVI